MTADVVNLRRFRKQAERAARQKTAAENRARFGEKKIDRTAREGNASLAAKKLDAHRRDDK